MKGGVFGEVIFLRGFELGSLSLEALAYVGKARREGVPVRDMERSKGMGVGAALSGKLAMAFGELP